jgi:hypothetical protein
MLKPANRTLPAQTPRTLGAVSRSVGASLEPGDTVLDRAGSAGGPQVEPGRGDSSECFVWAFLDAASSAAVVRERRASFEDRNLAARRPGAGAAAAPPGGTL